MISLLKEGISLALRGIWVLVQGVLVFTVVGLVIGGPWLISSASSNDAWLWLYTPHILIMLMAIGADE